LDLVRSGCTIQSILLVILTTFNQCQPEDVEEDAHAMSLEAEYNKKSDDKVLQIQAHKQQHLDEEEQFLQACTSSPYTHQ
jgi:hypothetical protein